MIENVLQLGRLDAGRETVERVAVDLNDAVRDSMALMQTEASSRGIRLDREEDPTAPTAWADPTNVRQVLLNLLSNAIKYNRPHGRVVVRTLRDGDRCGIEVEDEGPGLSDEQLRRLFVPFERLGRERSGTAGTGIGLTISRQLAHLMGGDITVDSQEGRGTRFALWLPRAEHRDVPAPGDSTVSDDAQLPPCTVLYVEDNAVNLLLMNAVFENDDDVRLLACETGRAAEALARRERVDLVLLDLGLPDMEGEEALRRMRQAFEGVPIIVVSADVSEATRQIVLRGGARACLPKPFDVASLRQAVRQALHESGVV
jgi:CheY-like chemotaxis protein